MFKLREARNTLVVFISDNGYEFGEHQLWGKGLPYTESIDIPFYLRWPGRIVPGSTARRFASNVDIVPTILGATGVSPTLRLPLDGHSLFSTRKRPYAFDEYFPSGGDWRPPWASLRSGSYDYTEWYTSSGRVTEYYDLHADPYELTNLLGDGNPNNDPDVRALSALLRSARSCTGSTCP
jgi:arylsulfatase A-like enzyme